ncbi:MAG: hypothetical protein JST00_39725 [Deltaproteobacteria bacterium]|nr:hypothetical protein [Deltaproteobacteria bacterium]
MSIPIDVAALPPNAQKILDPNGPAPLKGMAAKGLVPGLKPGEILAVVVALSLGADAHAETAKKTLEQLPMPLVNGALGGELQPGVLDVLGPLFVKDAALSEKILRHPSIQPETVAAMAQHATEGVAELIATNEERMLAFPQIIEHLYLNRHTRMSTADRILELAVRNGLELTGIPAFAQAKKAIEGELISEPTDEPTFDDQQFADAKRIAESVRIDGEEDTHRLNEETGQEEVVDKAKPLHAIWSDLRAPSKIRLLMLGNLDGERVDIKALRMIGVRDANPLVAVAALNAPGLGDSEVVKIAGLRNVAEDVLREIATSKEWTRHYMVKFNLVANPRTPFGQAAKWIMHLRENDLKSLAKSKEVPGAVQTAAKQQLQRKGKQG